MKTARAAVILATSLLGPVTLMGGGCSKAPAASVAESTTTVAYDVGGMHCSGCADAITLETKAVAGVKDVRCTIETRRAVIALSDPAAEPNALRAITKLGYTATKVAPDAPLSAEAQAANAKKAAAAPPAAEEAPAQPAAEPSSK
jgi:copper chaperone CopZ